MKEFVFSFLPLYGKKQENLDISLKKDENPVCLISRVLKNSARL
jgi:hypothetical protein